MRAAILLAAMQLLAGCSGESFNNSDSLDTSAEFTRGVAEICSELRDEMGRGDDTEPAPPNAMVENLESFRGRLDALDVPDTHKESITVFASAVDSSVQAVRQQRAATKAGDLPAALEARAEAAGAKLKIYMVVNAEHLPVQCAGGSRDELATRLFAGEADLVCFDFVQRLSAVVGKAEGRFLDARFILDEAVPLWREFVRHLSAIRPQGAARPAADKMIGLYDRAGHALVQLAYALDDRSEANGRDAQESFYSNSGGADEIAEAFGLTQCSDILGLGHSR